MNGLSTLLNNEFYIGIIRIERTGEHFLGKHEPLISRRLFGEVQDVLYGRKKIQDPNPENKGQPLPIPDKFIIVASFNPGLGYGVDTALASRFAVHIEWTSDYDLASVLGVPGKAITVAKNLQKRFDTGQVGWVPQLRELLRFRDIANTYGQTFATNNMVGLAPAEDQIEVSKVISSVFGVKEDGMVQEPLRVGRQI